jgi:hypothetical protein
VTALVLLAVTAALVVLLAAVFHLGVAAAIVGIVGIVATVPGAYLNWAALPAAATVPVRGRLAGLWDPVGLGVHQVIGGGPMPTYIRRSHDELLAAVLDPAVPSSRLLVLRGGSSTGKTRAAYQAVLGRLADWQLDYPQDPGTLATRLDAGIPERTVLWLGELRQYADVDGGAAVLGRLADLLNGQGLLVITTMWPEHWAAYTTAAKAGPGAADAAGTAGRLLAALPELTGRDPAGIDPARGGVIDVPDQFTTRDLQAAVSTGDRVLADAAAAAASAGQGGQVTQYLAGVPALLGRWAGPGGDPYGQAIITAAIDATRFGHASPLPAALVQEAAVGYLTDTQRTEDIATWRDAALDWAAEELDGAVRALRPVPPPSGTGVTGYQVADYLDQHGRRTRADHLGPASLWDALASSAANASDLTRIGQAARDRGLNRHAAALWTIAVTLGNAAAAGSLIILLGEVCPGDAKRAGPWAARHADLDDPHNVASLLRALHKTGANDAVQVLLARDPTRHASLNDPRGVAILLRALHESGDDGPAHTLATQAANHARLDDPLGVGYLIRSLHESGDDGAAHTLATRAADHASLNNVLDVGYLLRSLYQSGDDGAAHTLADRAANHARLDNPLDVGDLIQSLHESGDDGAAHTLATRAANHASLDNLRGVEFLLRAVGQTGDDGAAHTLATRAANHASLNDPGGVTSLLLTLGQDGDDGAVQTLLARDPARHASLNDPGGVADLLWALRRTGNDGAAHTLATRAANHASLNDPGGVTSLLRALHQTGDDGAVQTLLARDPARHASLNDPGGVAILLEALYETGASGAAHTLADRAANHASLNDPEGVTSLLRALCRTGNDSPAHTLATRAANHASLDHSPEGVADLIQTLHESGDDGAAQILADRTSNARRFSIFLEFHRDQASTYRFGREPDGTPAPSWNWQQPTVTTNEPSSAAN